LLLNTFALLLLDEVELMLAGPQAAGHFGGELEGIGFPGPFKRNFQGVALLIGKK
jgi:hypothetical protein